MIAATEERLRAAWSSLGEEWSAARQQWRDQVAAQFEREFWREWESDVPRLLKLLEELDAVIEDAVHHTE